jgi:hypothetical protein
LGDDDGVSKKRESRPTLWHDSRNFRHPDYSHPRIFRH